MRAETMAADAATLLGESVAQTRALSGGDLSQVVAVTMASNRRVVVKTGPAPRVEAAMLQALRAAGAPAPEVLAVSDRILVLEELAERGGLGPSGWRALGAALRDLHGAASAGYGWEVDYAFGPVPIRNAPCETWPGFWAERRLLSGISGLPAVFAHRLESLARDLPGRLPATPRPGLLHGDLWTGNLVACDGALSGLIDPACYHGHGEVDLAMLHLFGVPPAAFYDSYGALSPGWEERRAIYTLWPAIVHVRLFGAGYHGLLDRLLGQLGV